MSERAPMETAEMTGDEHEGKRGWGVLFLTAAFVIVVYLLSVGPVMKLLYRKDAFPPRAVSVLYGPLDVLYRQSPVAQRFYDWYLSEVWKVVP